MTCAWPIRIWFRKVFSSYNIMQRSCFVSSTRTPLHGHVFIASFLLAWNKNKIIISLVYFLIVFNIWYVKSKIKGVPWFYFWYDGASDLKTDYVYNFCTIQHNFKDGRIWPHSREIEIEKYTFQKKISAIYTGIYSGSSLKHTQWFH